VVGLRFNQKDGLQRHSGPESHLLCFGSQSLINGVSFGLGVPARVLPLPALAHNPTLKPLAYNPELAKKLLAEAGYKNG